MNDAGIGSGEPVKVISGSLAEIVKVGKPKTRILIRANYSGREWFGWVDRDLLEKQKSNPKGRRMATAKQIAWRKKFAAMARAGTLRSNPFKPLPPTIRAKPSFVEGMKAKRKNKIRAEKDYVSGLKKRRWKPSIHKGRKRQMNPRKVFSIHRNGKKIAECSTLAQASDIAKAIHRSHGGKVQVFG